MPSAGTFSPWAAVPHSIDDTPYFTSPSSSAFSFRATAPRSLPRLRPNGWTAHAGPVSYPRHDRRCGAFAARRLQEGPYQAISQGGTGHFETSIRVIDDADKIVWRDRVDSTPEAIASALKQHAPRAVRIGLESGQLSSWLFHELKEVGLPIICVDARHAKAALSLKVNKTDAWRHVEICARQQSRAQ
jgi:hypothetical protein